MYIKQLEKLQTAKTLKLHSASSDLGLDYLTMIICKTQREYDPMQVFPFLCLEALRLRSYIVTPVQLRLHFLEHCLIVFLFIFVLR